MISSSIFAMVVFDLTIIGIILAMLIGAWFFGLFEKGRLPGSGRFLILSGVGLTGIFYAADLFIMTVMPSLIGMDRAMAIMQQLHLDVRWLVSLASLLLIGTGLVRNAYNRQKAEKQFQEADRTIAKAQERIIESEMRTRAFVEQTPDAMYCFEFDPPVDVSLPVEKQIERSHDAVLIECNHIFAASIGPTAASRLLGIRLGELDSALDTESHARFITEFIKSGYRLVNYELEYTNIEGEQCALQVSLSGVVRQGFLRRIWGSERDIMEQTTTRADLAGRLRFQGLVAEMSSRLLTAPNPDSAKILTGCLGQTARYAHAQAGTIVCFDQDQTSVARRFSWADTDEIPFESLSPRNFPETWQRTLRGESFVLNDDVDLTEQGRREAEALRTIGVKSSIFLPLDVAGNVVGTCILSCHQESCSWDEKEISDLTVLVGLMATKVAQVEARQALDHAMSELQIAKSRLEVENRQLREKISWAHGFENLVGESSSLMRCLQQVQQVAATNTPVLLQGETGTGKELFAQAIHDLSDRRDMPLVKVNCAALPANLIESEMFGHEKGAFTGATARKPGRFELADGGTLFLDELADLPLDLQSKLLRALQSGEFERLGGNKTLVVDVRLIAATNRNLQEAITDGSFRPDLYYRVGAFPITLPPLRDRGGDIPLLADYFVRKHADKLGKEIDAISGSMLAQLEQYHWPGNVRELEGIIQRALITSTGHVLELGETLKSRSTGSGAASDQVSVLSADLRSVEKEHITRVLEKNDWVVGGETGAATQLGLPASTLRSRMKKLGISRPY